MQMKKYARKWRAARLKKAGKGKGRPIHTPPFGARMAIVLTGAGL